MAISVDKIYKTVLTILNREQRGQLRPGQFNRLAQQAQMELLEKAYYDYSRSLNKRINAGEDNDYGNMPKNLKEKLDVFSKEAELHIPAGKNAVKPGIEVKSRSGISLPSQVTAGTYSNLATTSNGSGSGLTVTVVATTNTFSTITIINGGSGYATGDVITIPQASMTGANANCTFPLLATDLNTHGFTILPTDLYRISNISRVNRSINLEKLHKSEFTYVNSSKLTTPSSTYPVYYRDINGIKISPSTLAEEYVTIDYVKTPAAPQWNASSTTGPHGSIVIDDATSVNFELHPSDETNLVIRILSYVGVVIKDPLIIQKIQQEEQTNFQKENI
jgi:hypothetical protein|tara:strand:+ start:6331 stop:7332 length:1002 start_codon:yes stop_codon:yes gene_type:complete